MKIFLFSIILRSKKPVQKFSTNGCSNTLKSFIWSNNTFTIQIDFMFITPISEGEAEHRRRTWIHQENPDWNSSQADN